MSKGGVTVSILFLILACTAISVSSAASPAPAPGNDKQLFFPTIDPQVKECLKSFSLVPGCVDEIFVSLTTGAIKGIGPGCCKVINEVADKCFPGFVSYYVFNPFLAPKIKSYCHQKAPAPHEPLS
ncbi:hypothetical protein H6P81_019463 [Aristolochia fimbriata]|uniref:Prolamin-like domain-containing protein n=1 Tax=Aristolochia fimbriata TaxID=158543 RepID=A0AAV7DRX7_ARIFI|nr:hypothetical protein H6P81_019463 [Aristolochia fimbriata]